MARQTQKMRVADGPADLQRLDKWLWFARIAKTRTIAAGLVADGRVRVNRARVIKPAHGVRAGDVVTVVVARGDVRVLRIVGCGVRRGPAPEAAQLFEEILQPMPPAPETSREPGAAPIQERRGQEADCDGAGMGGPVSDAGSGRPTKKDRRLLDRLRTMDKE